MKRRAALAAVLAACASAALPQQPHVVRINARKFAFTPSELRLARGVPVLLELTTADVFMGFNAPELNLRADIVPGQVARLAFTPQKAGSFDFLCDVFCGEGHEKMNGKIRVI
jgi:cytochrome c oxidase subunit II